MNSITPHEFYLQTCGRVIDYDKLYGGQCWDLFSYFSYMVFGRAFSCLTTSYVADLFNDFEKCGLSEYYEKLSGTAGLRDGDWCVWTTYTSNVTNSSHIAMFRLDNGDGTGIFLTQDPGVTGTNPTTQRIISYYNITGYLRPKIYIEYKQDILKPAILLTPVVSINNEADQIRINVSDLRVRSVTSTANNDTIIGMAILNGIYNCYDIKMENGYTWYKIADNQWIAEVDNSLTYIPKMIVESIETKTAVKTINKVKSKAKKEISILKYVWKKIKKYLF